MTDIRRQDCLQFIFIKNNYYDLNIEYTKIGKDLSKNTYMQNVYISFKKLI